MLEAGCLGFGAWSVSARRCGGPRHQHGCTRGGGQPQWRRRCEQQRRRHPSFRGRRRRRVQRDSRRPRHFLFQQRARSREVARRGGPRRSLVSSFSRTRLSSRCCHRGGARARDLHCHQQHRERLPPRQHHQMWRPFQGPRQAQTRALHLGWQWAMGSRGIRCCREEDPPQAQEGAYQRNTARRPVPPGRALAPMDKQRGCLCRGMETERAQIENQRGACRRVWMAGHQAPIVPLRNGHHQCYLCMRWQKVHRRRRAPAAEAARGGRLATARYGRQQWRQKETRLWSGSRCGPSHPSCLPPRRGGQPRADVAVALQRWECPAHQRRLAQGRGVPHAAQRRVQRRGNTRICG